KAEDQSTKKFAAVDRTPGRQLAKPIDALLDYYNRVEVYDSQTGEQERPKYELTWLEPSAGDEDAVLRQRYELSQRVQGGEFEGFLDIGPGVIEPGPTPTPGQPPDPRRELRYQSGKPDGAFPRWAGRAVNEAIQQRRFAAQNVPRDLVLTI